eukprot:PhF_6_TR5711/c0_g1_i1/m.8417
MFRKSLLRLTTATGGGGYKFFEDQFPQPKDDPPPSYQFYEDQMSHGAHVQEELPPPPPLTKEQKVKRLFKWGEEKGLPVQSHDWGWAEGWGPSPNDPGHNTWYKKSRMYMSYDEKTKHDIGHARPLQAGEIRQNPSDLNLRQGAAVLAAQEKHKRQPDNNQWVHYSEQEQKDEFGSTRQEFMNEWLERPGVNPNTLGKNIADYYGTNDKHSFTKAPRRPDWELPAAPDT